MKPELSIILVNWNCKDVIFNCIDSIYDTVKRVSFEIIVVDNGSKDGSVELIEEKYPDIVLIKNDYNNMFAGGNNQGYEASKGEYIFVLNTDTVVTENVIDDLVDVLKSKKERAVTCTLLNQDGSVQYYMHRGFPTFFRLLTALIYKKTGRFAFLPSVKNYLLIDNKFDKDFYVEQAAAAAIMLTRDTIDKLGYLFDNERFPLFYNDVDLCYRLYKKGYKIRCITSVKIFHLKSFSLKKLPKNKNVINHFRSFILFSKKHNLIFSILKV